MAKKEELIEIYKQHSGYSQNITNIRNTMNAVFISIHSVIFSFGIKENNFINVAIAIFGLIACYAWIRQLESLKILNCARIDVLTEIEKEIGFEFYKKEWDICKIKKYKSITSNDKVIVRGFMFLYIALFLYTVNIIFPYLPFLLGMLQKICLFCKDIFHLLYQK